MHERQEVGNTYVVDTAGIEVGRKAKTCQRGITAITSAINRYALRISNALRNQPVYAVCNIVLHRLPPLLVTRFKELATITRRTAEIHLEHGITTIAKELHFCRIAPRISCPGTTVRMHYDGQCLRRFGRVGMGQRKIRLDGQTIPRGVRNRVHRHHIFLLQPRRQLGKQRRTAHGAVVEVIATTRAVTAHINQVFLLLLIRGGDAKTAPLEEATQMLTKCRLFIIKIMANGVLMPLAIHCQQLLALARIRNARYVILLVGIKVLQLLTRCGIHQHERHLVAPEVCSGIHQTVVGRKLHEIHRLLKVRSQYRSELLLLMFAIKDLCIHPVHNGSHYAQLPLVVGHIPLPIPGILRQLREFARHQVQTIGVKNLRLALVHTDNHLVGNVLQVVNERGAHSWKSGIGTQVATVEIHAIELVILIARRVLHKQDALIRGPHIARHTARRLARQAHRVFAPNALHKDVHAVLIGRKEGEVVAIGRNLITRTVGIAEEVFEWILLNHDFFESGICLENTILIIL